MVLVFDGDEKLDDSVGSSLSNFAFSSEVGKWCVDKRCSGGAILWRDVDGGGGSSSSNVAFSSSSRVVLTLDEKKALDDVVDGASSLKVTFSLDVYGDEEGDVVVEGGLSSSSSECSFSVSKEKFDGGTCDGNENVVHEVGGGSLASKLAFSLSSKLDLDDCDVDAQMDGGSSSSKSTYSSEGGDDGDGMIWRRGYRRRNWCFRLMG